MVWRRNRGMTHVPGALFVVGTSRSGTSWVFDLCASHPQMSMGYESKLPIEGIDVYRRHQPVEDRAGMIELFAALRTEVDDPSNQVFLEQLTKAEVIDRAVAAHAVAPGWPSICAAIFCSLDDTTNWGNKLLRVELTPTLDELWPDSRFLILTRDPRGVMASQSKKFDHSVEYSAMYWNTHSRFVLDTLGLHPGQTRDNYMVMDLVEMARDPRPALEWAFAGIGLSTEPIDEFVATHPGDPDRLDRWRDSLPPARQRRVEEYCFDAMTELGYRPELAVRAKPITRAQRTLAMVREHGGELLRDPGAIRRKQVGRRVRAALGIDH